MQHPIVVAHGDGIGPEIMEAALHILKEAGANLELHPIEIGEKVYRRGIMTGIEPSSWELLRKVKTFFKAPITTPQGEGGFKSLNVTVRTTLGLFANIRPCASYAPYIATKHPKMDIVIVRENEEDLYIGIEYRQTPDVAHAIKVISRQGSEKIIRYAFEYARHHQRKKVTCLIKDNILKLTDGLFHKIFEEIAKEYSDIQSDHWIVDIGMAKVADSPENFDVIVTPNLYGDIISDIAAEISGSVGLAGSANIGDHGAMFEAIHGSAPRRAGQNVANPSALLLAGVMMMAHLGETEVAMLIHNAWLCTLEKGLHTYDIFTKGVSKTLLGTKEFGEAVVKNLGNKPKVLHPPNYKSTTKILSFNHHQPTKVDRQLIGVDIFVYFKEGAAAFQKKIESVIPAPFILQMITNRGARIWPDGYPETFCIEQYRCRFLYKDATLSDIVALMTVCIKAGFDIIKTENLYSFSDS